MQYVSFDVITACVPIDIFPAALSASCLQGQRRPETTTRAERSAKLVARELPEFIHASHYRAGLLKRETME